MLAIFKQTSGRGVPLIQALGPMKSDSKLVILILLSWLASGIVEPHLPNAGQPFNAGALIHGLVLSVLLFTWCKAHAKVHMIKPPAGAPLLVGIVSPIGIPYYALRGFGFRKGSLLLLKCLGTTVCCVVLYFLAYFFSSRVGT